ncbi:MAG: hypothetical protein HQM10_16155 [Candidatus Riflebacteria bacterium]|nr:hypothetical protein [Candidatus Riflebacteria bacterium]
MSNPANEPKSSAEFLFEIASPLADAGIKTFSADFGLQCGYTTNFDSIWCSKNQGPETVITIGRPKLPEGWVFLGDVVGQGNKIPDAPCLILRDLCDILAKPVD